MLTMKDKEVEHMEERLTDMEDRVKQYKMGLTGLTNKIYLK